MATLTLDMPEKLLERLEPFSRWLPAVLEISLLALKTPAVETASELVEFLASNPTTKDVRGYHASERAQERMLHLLNSNRAGYLGQAEAKELDELLRLEQLMINLKASLQD
jgi:hypothetical protein